MNKSCKVATLAMQLLALSTSAVCAIKAKSDAPEIKLENAPTCKVNFVDPHTNSAESERVIETVRKIFEAFGKHDLKTVAEYVADDCTGFAGDHKLLVGKEAILADMKMHIEERAEKKVSPLLSYTIERPYAQVTGDTAVVTFVAYKTYGGDHPHRKCSHTTNIFVKRDGRWQQSHYRNDWKEVSLVSDSLTATGDPIPGRELEKSATEPTR